MSTRTFTCSLSGPSTVKGNVLVIAAGNQDHLLAERNAARNGAGGAGCDGIVVIAHAAQLTDQLDPVLHPPNFLAKAPDNLIGDPSTAAIAAI